jgi:hypothetical protein
VKRLSSLVGRTCTYSGGKVDFRVRDDITSTVSKLASTPHTILPVYTPFNMRVTCHWSGPAQDLANRLLSLLMADSIRVTQTRTGLVAHAGYFRREKLMNNLHHTKLDGAPLKLSSKIPARG